MFINMNTVARTVENESIHLYFQRTYVNNPATKAKNEYHRRVSPIVFKGGRSRLSQSPEMNTARIINERNDKVMAVL